MAKTISINAGSSSLKWQLYNMPEKEVIAKGTPEQVAKNEKSYTGKYLKEELKK